MNVVTEHINVPIMEYVPTRLQDTDVHALLDMLEMGITVMPHRTSASWARTTVMFMPSVQIYQMGSNAHVTLLRLVTVRI